MLTIFANYRSLVFYFYSWLPDSSDVFFTELVMRLNSKKEVGYKAAGVCTINPYPLLAIT